MTRWTGGRVSGRVGGGAGGRADGWRVQAFGRLDGRACRAVVGASVAAAGRAVIHALLSPREGPVARDADFLGQVLFLDAARHLLFAVVPTAARHYGRPMEAALGRRMSDSVLLTECHATDEAAGAEERRAVDDEGGGRANTN